MRALVSEVVGGPDTLVLREDLPTPLPGANEVVIRVHACGVNYPDTLMIEDKYQFRPTRPYAPGGEVAGDVTAVGSDVSGFKSGDRQVVFLVEKTVPQLDIFTVMAERALRLTSLFCAAPKAITNLYEIIGLSGF